ncbi:Mg2+ transporter [Apiospora phragmitis]|uniref:Mg2+ transporter n=1 Tax=Apiospora phragmitis TaxID=2905665 RepID=A0ABR1VHV0_9PEZI
MSGRHFIDAEDGRGRESPPPPPPRRATAFNNSTIRSMKDRLRPVQIGGNVRHVPHRSIVDPGLIEDVDDTGFSANTGWRGRASRYGGAPHYAPQWPAYAHYPAHGPYSQAYGPGGPMGNPFAPAAMGNVFSFKPRRAPPVGPVAIGELDIVKDQAHLDTSDGLPTETTKTNPDGPQNRPSISSTLDVFQSRYTGDGFLDGTHSAKLTVIHDAKKQSQPLFRWMHLSQPILDLEKLSAEIMKTASLSNADRYALAKLFTQIKREAVKTRLTAEGKTVWHMEPKHIRVAIPSDDSRPTLRGIGCSSDQKHITWFCIPYFSLETYRGVLSANSGTEFPIETLLQSRYARTSRTRETQQVVYQDGQTADDKCFHISQLWCIVIDKSLLVTCGRMSSTILKDRIVSISPEPPNESPYHGKMIYVSYYGAVLWSIALEDCSTWFGFINHFHAFWPLPVRIFHRNEVATEVDWPRILHTAKHSSTPLTLELRVGVLPSPPVAGALQALEKAATKAPETNKQRSQGSDQVGGGTSNETAGTFHVFTWLDTVQLASQNDTSNEQALTQQLSDIESYLLNSAKMLQRSAYRCCNWSTRRLVHAYLEDQGQDIDSQEETRKKQYSHRVDIYNAADLVSQFFLPPRTDQDAPTVGKFWDAILSLVEMPDSPRSPRDDDESPHRPKTLRRKRVVSQATISVVRTELREMTRRMVYFQGILRHLPATERRSIFIPDTLVRAWMHLLMGLIMSSEDTGSWEEYLKTAEKLIQKGSTDIISSLPTVDLMEYIAMQPLELASLFSLKLLQDSTDRYTSLTDSYSEYIKYLENEIMVNPNRSHQSRISWFREEIAIIRNVVNSQRQNVSRFQSRTTRVPPHHTRTEGLILKQETERSRYEREERDLRRTMHDKYAMSHGIDRYRSYEDVDFDASSSLADFSKLSPTDPNGLLGLLIGDCKTWLERRDREFGDMDAEASRLDAMVRSAPFNLATGVPRISMLIYDTQNVNQIDATKDRQEAAVYAFTMVTIVFLPLGTISSIFGMNTSDIANLELSQWVYWATALPVTVMVIVFGLWWMGELRNLVNWVLGRRGDGYGSVGRDSRRAQRLPRANWPAAAACGTSSLPPSAPPL